jgi:S1-C subfamily serine protease
MHYAVLSAGAQSTSRVTNHRSKHHVAPSSLDHENLEQRYRNLGCALLSIQSGNSTGTGFYINDDGDAVTASHVIGNRQFAIDATGDTEITFPALPESLTFRDQKGTFTKPVVEAFDRNANNWAYDIALLHTGRKTDCWLKLGLDTAARPGQHLITMGFPSLAFGSLTMYSGILSARLRSTIPMAWTTSQLPIQFPNEFLRVQMPISPGISGSPIIDDDNKVIGVITTAGMLTNDVLNLLRFQAIRDQQAANSGNPGNQADIVSILAHSLQTNRDFASPGYGDAVPIHYLQRPIPAVTPQLKRSSHR